MSQLTNLITGKKKDKQPGDKKDEKKTKKRINNFLNEKSLQKKWKILTKFMEKESEEDIHKFLTENADNVFSTIMSSYNQLEMSKDKTKKNHEADVTQVLEVLKKCFPHWANQFKSRWKSEEILSLLQKILAKQNKHFVRVFGFEMLLVFIDSIFQTENIKEVLNSALELFARAINLQSFDPKQEVIVKYTPPSVDSNLLLVPSQVPESEEESTEFLNVFFVFLNSRTGKSMDFWFDQFKRIYLTLFYPRVFKELGLLPQDNKCGFMHHCPYVVQRTIIDHFDQWKSNQALCAKLWEDKNAIFMLEVSRQCCQLPVTFASTVRKSIQLYRHWFVTKRNNTLRDELVQEYWRILLDNISALFIMDPQDKHEEYTNLFQEIFSLYNSLSFNMSTSLDPRTWQTLQYSILNTNVKFFEYYKTLRREVPQCVETVADELISYLFLIWLRSPITNEKMWQDFHAKFVSLLDLPHAIRGWKDKVLKLTTILCEFYYKPPPSEEGHDETSNTGVQQQQQQQQQQQPQVLPDSAPVTSPSLSSSAAGATPTLHPPHSSNVPKEHKDPRSATQKEVVTNYLGVTWNEVKIKELWFTVFNICGNINMIKNPLIYEIAMSCIAETVDTFLTFERRIPLKDEPRKIPLMETFLPWLIQACYSPPEKAEGVVLAYRVLGKLFCCQHKKPLPLELLSHFYRVVQNGLRYEREQVRDAVIYAAKNIFSFDLPGVAILIPDFIREITNIFGSRTSVNPETQRNAITIVNSLICFPKHYEGTVFCDLVSRRDMSCAELREHVSNIILSLLNNQNLDSTAKCMALWGSFVLIFEEVKSGAPIRMNVITSVLQLILEHLKHRDESVAYTAAEVLTGLTVLIDSFNEINMNLAFSIISILCDNISFLIREPGGLPNKEKIITECFQALASWLIVRPNVFLTDYELSMKLFQVVELGLFGKLGSDLAQPVTTESVVAASVEHTVEKDDRKKKKEEKKLTKDLKKRSTEVAETVISTRKVVVETLLEKLARQPLHGSNAVQQAAEIFLFMMSNFYNNFPSPAGASQNDSVVPDEVEENAIFFMNYERQIFSISQGTNALGEKIARVIVRDPVGKFCWECQIEYGDNLLVITSPQTRPQNQNQTVVMQQMRNRAAEGSKPPNVLADMLTLLYTKFPECSDEKITSLYVPRKFRDSYAGEVQMGRNLVDGIIRLDDQTLKSYVETRLPCDKDTQKPEEPISTFHLGRLLLNHFGFLSPRNRRNFHLIEDSTRWRRTLVDLDKVKGREVFKIGVIYVAEGQENQNEILRNEAGSAFYHAFLNGLGWPVDLKEHQGFRGGLTTDGTSGVVAPYWANERFELIYHVVTYMPTKDSDVNQITKKRHVGNDFIHIVWSEHKRDYNPDTIVSQFNDGHIVIYPLPSGLFRIQIFKKEKLRMFGPLMDGMVVTQQILSELTRITALNAYRNVRSTQKGYENPYVTRLNYIKEACRRYRTPKPAEEFFSVLFPLRSEPHSGISAKAPTTNLASSAVVSGGVRVSPPVPVGSRPTPTSGSTPMSGPVSINEPPQDVFGVHDIDSPFLPIEPQSSNVKSSRVIPPPLNLPPPQPHAQQTPLSPVSGIPPSLSGTKSSQFSLNTTNVIPKMGGSGGGPLSPKVTMTSFRPPPPTTIPPTQVVPPPVVKQTHPTTDQTSGTNSRGPTGMPSLPRQNSSPTISSAVQPSQPSGGTGKMLSSSAKVGVSSSSPQQGKMSPQPPVSAPPKVPFSAPPTNNPNPNTTLLVNRPPPPTTKKAGNFTLSRAKGGTEGTQQ